MVKKVVLKGIDKQYQESILQYVQQDIRASTGFKKTIYGVFKVGEPPHTLDSPKVEFSRYQIELYLRSKGFYKAKVKADIKIKRKKATITFTAERGAVSRFDTLSLAIADSAVNTLYEANRARITRVHTGGRADLDSVQADIESMYKLMRRNGYYDYVRAYSHVYIDSNLWTSKANLLFSVDNPPGKSHHEVYTIGTTSINIANSAGEKPGTPDSARVDGQYKFKDYSRRFTTGLIAKYIFLQQGTIFNIDKDSLTSNRLYDLNVFRNVKIEYEKAADSSNTLNPVIELVPLKRMSNSIEGEYTFNSGRNGFNFGNTYTNRNVFGGAEQLDIKLRYGVLFDSRLSGGLFSNVFNRDFQLGATLTFPRLLVPFGLDFNARNGVPHTSLTSSVQVFDQKSAFTNRTFINAITYDWVETKYKLHSLTPVNFEYRKGKLDDVFKQSLEDQGYSLYILTNEKRYISMGSLYTFTYNAIRVGLNQNFTYFKTSADLAGNSIGLVRTILGQNSNDGTGKIFGLNYLQYAKAEIDFRRYFSLGTNRQFVMRINPGIGVPYGNSQSLPFEKNFYVGGTNGVRAWQSRTLGPGQYNRASVKDVSTRTRLRNLDQLGELKLEGNLEYRFLLSQNFYGFKVLGAAFTDFGNVWRLHSRDTVINPGGKFEPGRFYKQIAIGTGGGIRLDLQYFVIRLDVGVKMYDPQFVDSGNPWVIRHIFSPKKFKDAYAITNNPDRYRFAQYNFGISLPF